jgi:hypothetical protein
MIGILHYIIEAQPHHLTPACYAPFDPNQRFLISQTFLAGIAAFATSWEAIIANDASTTASIAAFGHCSDDDQFPQCLVQVGKETVRIGALIAILEIRGSQKLRKMPNHLESCGA